MGFYEKLNEKKTFIHKYSEDGVSHLVITPRNLESISLFNKDIFAGGDIKGLALYRFSNCNLDFLRQFKNVKSLHISGEKLFFKDLRNFPELTSLTLGDEHRKYPVDISMLSQLKIFSGSWGCGLNGIFELKNPEFAKIHNCNNCLNLSQLKLPENLLELHIILGKINRLSGCENLRKLKKIKLIQNSSLNLMDGLDKLKHLEEIYIECLKKIHNFNNIEKCTNIKSLSIIKSSSLMSLGWLKNFKLLESFVFMVTDVIDGDMSPLFSLENLSHLAFTSKKHFSHTEKMVKEFHEKKGRKFFNSSFQQA